MINKVDKIIIYSIPIICLTLILFVTRRIVYAILIHTICFYLLLQKYNNNIIDGYIIG